MVKTRLAAAMQLAAAAWRSGRSSGPGYAAGRIREETGNLLSGLLARQPGGRLPSSASGGSPAIILLAGIHWTYRRQRPQQLADALGRQGCAVYYVVPGTTGAHVPGWRLYPQKEQTPPLLCLYGQRHARLPALWREPSGHHRAAQSLRLLCCRLKDIHSRVYILVQHPLWASVLAELKDEYLFYDCLDDFNDFDNADADTPRAEAILTHRCTGIISTSLPLHQRWLQSGKPQALIRNACDYAHFANAQPLHVPHTGKIIGFHGAIAEWFDTGLVRTLARAFPQHTFLLVGGDTAGAGAALRDLGNVLLPGEVPYSRLPAYVAAFDIGIVPFKIRPLTHGTNPVKVYEYFAAGKPVITPPLAELLALGDLLTVARDGEWVQAVNAVLSAPPDPAAARAYAACQTWDHRAKALLRFMQHCAEEARNAH